MKKIAVASLAVLSAAFLTSCTTISGVGEDNTPDPSTLTNFSSTVSPVLLWSNKIESRQTVSIFDFSNGNVFWKANLKEDLAAGPAISTANNLVVAGDTKGGLWAFNLNNGQILWHITLTDPIVSTPIITDHKIFVRTLDGTVWSINTSNGSPAWHSINNVPMMVLSGGSKPMLINNLIIVGSSNGLLTAYNSETGAIKWQTAIARPQGVADVEKMVDIVANPKLSGNMVYVVTYQGNLAAINSQTGSTLWSRPLSSYTGLAVSNSAVFVTDAQSDVWAFNRMTGQEIWHQNYLKFRHLTSPAIVDRDNAIVIGDGEGYVHWLSQLNGQTIGRIKINHSAITEVPQIKDGSIYILSSNGLVSAYTS